MQPQMEAVLRVRQESLNVVGCQLPRSIVTEGSVGSTDLEHGCLSEKQFCLRVIPTASFWQGGKGAISASEPEKPRISQEA
jgi:hypothetical protein